MTNKEAFRRAFTRAAGDVRLYTNKSDIDRVTDGEQLIDDKLAELRKLRNEQTIHVLTLLGMRQS